MSIIFCIFVHNQANSFQLFVFLGFSVKPKINSRQLFKIKHSYWKENMFQNLQQLIFAQKMKQTHAAFSATGPATVALYCFCWGFYFPLNERKCSTTTRMNAKLLPRALTCAKSSTCETEEQQTSNLWLHHGGEWAEQQPKKDKKRQTNEDPTLEGFPEEF